MIELSKILADTISGILINLPWFILIWIGFKMLSREIKIGIRSIPEWIDKYFKLRMQQLTVERAILWR